MRRRRFWVAAAVGVTINVTWHFLVNWMGIFFQEERRLGLLVGGMVSALPFLAADAGNLGGGVLTQPADASGHRHGLRTEARDGRLPGPRQLRRLGRLRPVAGRGLVLLCLAAMGTAAYMVNYFAFGQDVAPEHTGLVIGYLGGLGNLFAAGFMPVAGWISQGRWGFAPNFLIVGLLPLLGLVVLLPFWGQDDGKSG